MKPPADLPLELVLIGEAFARRLEMAPGDFWAVVYRKKKPPPGWAAAWADAFEPLVRPDDFPVLTAPATHATLATHMQAETRETRVSRARLRKDNRKHPFVAALVAKGKTVTEFAREIGYPRATVQSWYTIAKDSARPIPLKAAKAIQATLGVPLSTWPRKVD